MRTGRCVTAALLAAALAAGPAAAADKGPDYRKELRAAQSHQGAKRYAECVAACEKMLEHFTDSAQVREITWLKIDALVSDSQHENALKSLAALAASGADDQSLQAAVALRTGDVQRLFKKLPEAVGTYRKLAETTAGDLPDKAAEAWLRAGDVLMDMDKPADARQAFWRAICSCPLEPDSCQHAQGRIVEGFRAEGKLDEALAAARVLYDAAGSEKTVRAAAQTLAQAFLAVDGMLARANEFLAYQRFGPDGSDGKAGTDDDVKTNHLAKVKHPALPPAVDKQFQVAIDAQPKTRQGHRARGMLWVYRGRPKEAAAAFLLAFKSADAAELPGAAQELVLIGMKAHTASFHGLGAIFEYIAHGPKGKSGKENIADPFAGL